MVQARVLFVARSPGRVLVYLLSHKGINVLVFGVVQVKVAFDAAQSCDLPGVRDGRA